MMAASHTGSVEARMGRNLPMAGMLVAGITLVIARRPDAVTNPQFFAEDGSSWFADAYNHGALSVLLRPEAGYLEMLPRLVAIPASHLDLVRAALLMNLVAIVIQVAPAALLVSRRFQGLVPQPAVRGILGLIYLTVPSQELNANITNAQWHLAILAIMVLIAVPPVSTLGRAFDLAVLLLSGLTGPFAVLLLPAALIRASTVTWRRWFLGIGAAVGATLLLQIAVAASTHRPPTARLGIGAHNLLLIVSNRIVLAGTLAQGRRSDLHLQGTAHGTVIAGIIAAAAGAAGALVLWRASMPLRIFLLFCAGSTAGALLSPLVSPQGPPAWDVLATSVNGDRYFFAAELAWLACLLWLVSRIRWKALRLSGELVIIVALASGLALSWQYPAFADDHPARYAAVLQAAAAGTRVVIPINPNPMWSMILVRH